MRLQTIMLLMFISVKCFGQKNQNLALYNKLKEVEGTPYVIAHRENESKLHDENLLYLLFINTENGETSQIEFPRQGYYWNLEQIKIDSLNINIILVNAKTIDTDGKRGYNYKDPTQLFLIAVDGSKKTQLTPDNFYVTRREINTSTGKIVVSGYIDVNMNSEFDKDDKTEIHIYDLSRMSLIHKL